MLDLKLDHGGHPAALLCAGNVAISTDPACNINPENDKSTDRIDIIATDHAPHHYDEKQVEFDHAPFGITGLETAVSLCFDRLIHRGVITLTRLIELLSINPAKILGVPGGSLSEGAPADITILAPDLPVTVAASRMRSRSRNTPFDSWALMGGVAATLVGGRTVYLNEEFEDLRI